MNLLIATETYPPEIDGVARTLAQMVNGLDALGHLIAPFALLVASSRLILGLHYPSDVLVGALIGGSIAWTSFLLIA